MISTRRLRWVLIFSALFAAVFSPSTSFSATCAQGELCPGRIWDPAGLQYFQHVSYNPAQDQYFLTTSTWVGLSGMMVGANLNPDGSLVPATIEISPNHGATAIATAYNSVEDGYLAVWRTASPTNVYIRHLDSDGTPISNIFNIGNGDPPSVAYSPHTNRYVVVWYKNISGTYYTFYAMIDGDPTNPSPVLAAGTLEANALSSVVAYNPTSQKFLVVFVKDFAPAPRQADIFGRTITAGGTISPAFAIDASGNNQQRPILAASNTGFLVVYEDWAGGGLADAVGARLSADGGYIQRVNVAITSAWDVPGAVTYNAATNSYVAAWRSAYNDNNLQHHAREFDAATGAPKGGNILFTLQNASVLSAAARPNQGGPQAVVLWGIGNGGDGVHAGIIDLPPAPPLIQPPMPTAFFNTPYDQKVPVEGGKLPLTYQLVSGQASLTALGLAPAGDFATTGRIIGTPNGLGTSGIFRVRVTDADNRSDEKDLTVTVTLAPPTTIAPSGGINDPTPTFQWTAVPGAANYNLVVDNVTDGTTPINTTLAPTTFTPASNMVAGKNYQWRVRAINGGNSSAFSANVPFELDVTAPFAAVLDVSIPLSFSQLPATAIQSSGDYDATTYDKTKATDGNNATLWSTPARPANQAEFITVDLGSEKQVSRVRLRSSGSAVTFPIDFTIQTSLDNSAFTTVSTSTNFSAAANTEYSFTFSSVTARYVRMSSTKVGQHPSGYFTQIAELAVDGAVPTANSLKVSWLAPGEDGAGGGAVTSYDLRISNVPITAGNFSSREQLPTGTPKTPGSLEEVVKTGLNVESTYHVALLAFDNAGNISAMSTGQGDTLGVPPGAVTGFTVTNPAGDTLKLNWVASGDDGAAGGPADVFTIRHSTSPLTPQNFSAAPGVLGVVPDPAAPGMAQNMTATGLNHTTSYYFGIRVWDEKGNASPIVFASGATLDQTAPAMVSDLTGLEGSVTSTFVPSTATASSGDISAAYGKDKAVDGIATTSWSTPGRPTQQTEFLIVDTGAVRPLSKVRLQARDVLGALFPQDYTIDVSSNGSTFAQAASATGVSLGAGATIEHTFAPGTMGRYVRLNVTKSRQYSDSLWYVQLAEILVYEASLAANSVTVTWTAPADDASSAASGPASMYVLKRSLSPIVTTTDFNNAMTVPTGAPQTPGSLETVVVGSLPAETRYHFRLRTQDDAMNLSPMSNPTFADTPGTPPAAVTTLAVTGKTGTTVSLQWNATGDDGMSGPADRYDIRRSTAPIGPVNFEAATQVVQNIVPGMPGAVESFTVTGLTSETTYYFALKVLDELDNASAVSNNVTATTNDITPPAKITDLAGLAGTFNYIERNLLPISVSGEIAGFTKEMAVDKNLATSWSTPGRAVMQQESLVVQLITGGPVPVGRVRLCSRAETGTLFPQDFDIQAAVSGSWVTVLSRTDFVAAAGTCYPFVLTPTETQFIRLRVTKSRLYGPSSQYYVQLGEIFVDQASSTVDQLALSWTAPGDNGFAGPATAYEMRFSTDEMTEGNFGTKPLVTNPPVPGPPNVAQNFTLTGLSGETMYYVGMRTRDETFNWSPVSNIITQTTAGVLPSAVTDLTATPTGETTMNVSWTTTGDDGMGGGPADHFDLRISTSPITSSNFDSATPVPGLPTPLAPGTLQGKGVTGLTRDTTYYLAIKVFDEVGPSAISNLPMAVTNDATLPSAVTIAASNAPITQLLSPAAVASSGDIAASYSKEKAVDGNLATSWSTPARTVMQEEFLTLDALQTRNFNQVRLCARDLTGSLFPEDFVVELSTNGTVYTAPVVTQAGFVAAAGSCYTFNFTPQMARYARLRVTKSRVYVPDGKFYAQLAEFQLFQSVTLTDRITLTFNATGDDGVTGNATSYDVRYSTSSATPFASMTPFVGEPAPSPPGTPETIVVTGLTPATQYYFLVKVIDNRNNASAASNLASATTGSP